jgi:hypothetical protein
MTLEEKIASVPKLERIDSSIESCIKILEQEFKKRKVEDPGANAYTNSMITYLAGIKDDFDIMKNKR